MREEVGYRDAVNVYYSILIALLLPVGGRVEPARGNAQDPLVDVQHAQVLVGLVDDL